MPDHLLEVITTSLSPETQLQHLSMEILMPSVLSYLSSLPLPLKWSSELAGTFIHGQYAFVTRNTLEDLGYPQHATPNLTDNMTAQGIAHRTIHQKRSNAMDMLWNWIQDRVARGEHEVIWAPGADNSADYFAKAHPARYYIEHRPKYLSD